MTGESTKRFARWQSVSREHLWATSNLVLGLSTGLLAFTVFLALEGKLETPCAFGFSIAAIIILAISAALALACALNRLTDFRVTAQIANPKNDEPYKEQLREKSTQLGKLTWLLFKIQVWTFAIGTAAVSIGVLVQLIGSAPAVP